MTSLIDGIIASGSDRDSRFPNAPDSWTPSAMVETARAEGLEVSEEHWEVVRALQEFFARHGKGAVNLRELHDALDEKFHGRGGMKYLYTLLPGGPIAQGSRLAGLEVPAGAVDKGFGSVA